MAKCQKGNAVMNENETKSNVSVGALVVAAFKIMPWLEKILSPGSVKKVSLKKFNADGLNQRPKYSPASSDFFGSSEARNTNNIYLFTKGGECLGEVGVKNREEHTKTLNLFFWTFSYKVPSFSYPFSETVGEALKRLDPQNQAYFVVMLFEDFRTPDMYDVIIATPAIGENIHNSIEEELERATREVVRAMT